MEMKWYVLQAFSGYENKVKQTLQDTIKREGFEKSFGEILVPTEEVLEIKDGHLYGNLIDIIKNAEVIYYSRNGLGELIGINKSKSGSINIKIAYNDIEEIRLINKVDGDLSPESLFPNNRAAITFVSLRTSKSFGLRKLPN